MAGKAAEVLARNLLVLNSRQVRQVRHAHVIRGRPPTVARTLRQRLQPTADENAETSIKVDIGLPMIKRSEKTAWYSEHEKVKSNSEIERMARKQELLIDLEKVRQVWLRTEGPQHLRKMAEHYGIYQDLFGGNAYFLPVVDLRVDYQLGDEKIVKVHRGNVIKSIEAANAPTVSYEAEKDSLWSLIMTTPDGDAHNSTNESCHWFVANIPGNAVERGQEIVEYLRPITPKGVGYFRYIFILYKQEKELDFREYRKDIAPSKPILLKDRAWNTFEFYRKFQDHLTPAGLAFFQSDWDPSLQQFYHQVLQMKQPVYEYDFPQPYVKPQEWFPLRKAFNTYLDRYKDPKDVMKRYLLKKLFALEPLKKPEPALKFPNAHPYNSNDPSWLRIETKKDRLGWGRINDLKRNL